MGALMKGVGKPGCNLLLLVRAFNSLSSGHNVLCTGGHLIFPVGAHSAAGLHCMFIGTGRRKEMPAVAPLVRCGAVCL